MANINVAFGSLVNVSATELCTMTAGSAIGWESSAIDNSANLYLDVLVQVNLAFAASAPAGDKAVYVYAYGALSGTYPNPITGSQGLVTAGNANTGSNVRLLEVMPYGTASQTLISQPLSIANAFGGSMPSLWGLFILNDAGATLSTATSAIVKYKGVYATSA